MMSPFTLFAISGLALLLGVTVFTKWYNRSIVKPKKVNESEQRWKLAIEASGQGLWDWDAQTNGTYISRRWKEILGYAEGEIGETLQEWDEIIHPDDKFLIYEAIAKHFSGTTSYYESEHRMLCKNGEYLWIHDRGKVTIWDQNKKPLRMLGTITDISKRKAAEILILEQKKQIQQMIENQNVATFVIDAQHRVLHWNQACEVLTGVQAKEMIGTKEAWRAFYSEARPCLADLVLNEENELAVNYYTVQHKSTLLESALHAEAWLNNVGGKRRYVIFDATPIYDMNGKISIVIETLQDVTVSKLAEHALLEEKANAYEALKSLENQKRALDQHSIVAKTDVGGRITYVNEKFCTISGYSQDELLGKNHRIINSGRHPKEFFEALYHTISAGKVWHGEICNLNKNGNLYWVETTIVPFIGDDGNPQEYIAIRNDITESKLAEQEIRFLAFNDPLTQLPNRRLLVNRLTHALAASARSGKRGALLFMDLDHFKTLNDTLGHDVGDELLKQVAARLTANVREGDTVSRLGGDEFVVLLEGLSEEKIEAAAQTKDVAEKILRALNQPYQLDTHLHHSTSSIGANMFIGHEQSYEELLKQADIAMYQSKTEGRNTIRFFDPKMQEEITNRADLERELRKAIEQNQFELLYQIQVDSSGQAIGAEALIRWQHPERGMISPFNFISLAEETGLILPIGQWVLDSACAQLKIWEQNQLTRDLLLAVNVSAKQFFQSDFVEHVLASITRHHINPSHLKLELTESMLVDNINDIIGKMEALSKIGVHFSLDDFGTGYSSLQYLKKLPLNQLKIDKSFVRDIATDSSDRAIVRTIVTMARSLDINVIAEGVETEEQRQFLLDNGCMYFQGYFFSKPVPIDEFEALLSKKLIDIEGQLCAESTN